MSLLLGAWNGLLVAVIGIQPIVATLILMVAGRGVAWLVTDGQIINFNDATLVYLGNGHLLGLPFTLTLVLAMLAATQLLTRQRRWELFIESVGDNGGQPLRGGERAPRQVHGLRLRRLLRRAGGAGGGLEHQERRRQPRGPLLELDAILAVVVGGTALTGGRFYLMGSVIGALLIQTLTACTPATSAPTSRPCPRRW
ncbi:MAG: hypothetical protein U1G05_18225 [Kiritimatiellia bacterium]